MNFIKFKWTLSLGLFLQLFYVGLNGKNINVASLYCLLEIIFIFKAYPTYLTYLPASALGGLGQALIFTAAGTSIQKLCQLYCEMTSADAARTQGIFKTCFLKNKNSYYNNNFNIKEYFLAYSDHQFKLVIIFTNFILFFINFLFKNCSQLMFWAIY